MSTETKQQVEEVKREFKKVSEQSETLRKKAAGFDKQLSEKIKKVGDASSEVVRHIEERSNTHSG